MTFFEETSGISTKPRVDETVQHKWDMFNLCKSKKSKLATTAFVDTDKLRIHTHIIDTPSVVSGVLHSDRSSPSWSSYVIVIYARWRWHSCNLGRRLPSTVHITKLGFSRITKWSASSGRPPLSVVHFIKPGFSLITKWVRAGKPLLELWRSHSKGWHIKPATTFWAEEASSELK